MYPLLQAVKQAASLKVWGMASQHHLGAGLEAGVDMTVFQRVYKKLVKEGQNNAAGVLMNAAAGGVWTRDRIARAKREQGLEFDSKCPNCGTETQDDYHLFWGCVCLDTSSDPRIRKSQWLVGEAWRGRETRPCFYMRGLTPKDWTSRNQGAEEACYAL